MTNEPKTELTRTEMSRREMLKTSLTAGGLALAGFHNIGLPVFLTDVRKNPFQGGQYLGLIEFAEEGLMPMETPLGVGLDGRLYTDLSAVGPDRRTISNERFYLRTRASEFLEDGRPWAINVTGLLKQPVKISPAELRKISQPVGLHLMECSGNARPAHFGLLSVADWSGARVSEVLDFVKISQTASHVLISGFDRYPYTSSTSLPGASWIFTVDQLKSSKAFFATRMNGSPLPKDHGAPIRLLMPGWYGCTCIKWVDEIQILGEGGATTSQMREFASRTSQQGVPELVKDYRPAIIEQTAMPVRVEKWLVDQKIKYRVCGIAWGGSRLVSGLGIRFNPEENFAPVDDFEHTANDPWSFWTHAWTPIKTGAYSLQLKVQDPVVPSRRLDAGYYVRSVEIAEI